VTLTFDLLHSVCCDTMGIYRTVPELVKFGWRVVQISRRNVFLRLHQSIDWPGVCVLRVRSSVRFQSHGRVGFLVVTWHISTPCDLDFWPPGPENWPFGAFESGLSYLEIQNAKVAKNYKKTCWNPSLIACLTVWIYGALCSEKNIHYCFLT